MISLAQRRLCIVRRRGGIESIRYPNGMIVPVSSSRTPEQLEDEASIFVRGYRPKQGDVVVDAGAGSGNEVLVFASLVGRSGRVVAVEAHPAAFEALTKLCRLNRLDHVTCVHAALLDAPGTAHITDLPEAYANSVVAGDGKISVPAKTLDDVLSTLGVVRVDLLKLNIEGAELRALKGFANGLQRTGNLAVACHDRRADDGEPDVFRTREGVISLLESGGFGFLDVPRGSDPWERDYLYARARTRPPDATTP